MKGTFDISPLLTRVESSCRKSSIQPDTDTRHRPIEKRFKNSGMTVTEKCVNNSNKNKPVNPYPNLSPCKDGSSFDLFERYADLDGDHKR